MAILKPATNQTAFLKAGLYGFAASGKSTTAALLAIGLAEQFGQGKPVAFLDTETGSDYLIPKFRAAGVELLVAKTRAFADLVTFMREAEGTCSVAIVDSLTHIWTDLKTSYERRMKRKYGLEIQDWGKLKEEWQEQFIMPYLNSQMHFILCGRAGFEYENVPNEEKGGKLELVKVGTKMKSETESGFEPSLVIEMEAVPNRKAQADAEAGRRRKGGAPARGFINRAYILKDRSDTMNGAILDFPKYGDFAPIIAKLNIGGEHFGVDATRNSEAMFDDTSRSAIERKRRVEIVLEEIKNAFIEADCGGTSKEDKKRQVDLFKKWFGTSSWTAITQMKLEDLESANLQLRADLGLLAPRTETSLDEVPAALRSEDVALWGIGSGSPA